MSSPRAPAVTELVRVALVRRVHGVRGGVRVEILGDDPRRFRRGMTLVEERTGRSLTVRAIEDVGGGGLLLRFEGIDTPEAAEPLRGAYLCVGEESARRLPHGEYFVWQLTGLRAVETGGAELGTVSDVEEGVTHDVLVVEASDGSVRRYPMVAAFVSEVAVDRGEIVLTPWEEED